MSFGHGPVIQNKNSQIILQHWRLVHALAQLLKLISQPQNSDISNSLDLEKLKVSMKTKQIEKWKIPMYFFFLRRGTDIF